MNLENGLRAPGAVVAQIPAVVQVPAWLPPPADHLQPEPLGCAGWKCALTQSTRAPVPPSSKSCALGSLIS